MGNAGRDRTSRVPRTAVAASPKAVRGGGAPKRRPVTPGSVRNHRPPKEAGQAEPLAVVRILTPHTPASGRGIPPSGHNGPRMPRLLNLARLVGIDPVKGLTTLGRLPRFFRQRSQFRTLCAAGGSVGTQPGSPAPAWREGKIYPCLTDDLDQSGTASGAYFHQDLYVAQKIFEAAPRRHLDVASRVDGFVAHVASFRRIEVLDIRPLSVSIPNVTFRQADLMRLPEDLREAADSVSCLHALEHFGLGRYGDPLDAEGHLKGFESLAAMVEPGGRLYLSMPIGPQRYEFNAHRVFAIATPLAMATPQFDLEHFSFVDDRGDMHRDVPITEELLRTNANCVWGCGIYVFRKRR